MTQRSGWAVDGDGQGCRLIGKRGVSLGRDRPGEGVICHMASLQAPQSCMFNSKDTISCSLEGASASGHRVGRLLD